MSRDTFPAHSEAEVAMAKYKLQSGRLTNILNIDDSSYVQVSVPFVNLMFISKLEHQLGSLNIFKVRKLPSSGIGSAFGSVSSFFVGTPLQSRERSINPK